MHGSFQRSTDSTGHMVYNELKLRIMNLDLPPGASLSEKEMALTFDVSRTPVRESFVRLAQEGLVHVLPQRGTKVALIDPAYVEEARFMREQLEKAVIRLACVSFPEEQLLQLKHNLMLQEESMEKHDGKQMFELDEAFHRTLFEGCQKLGIWSVMQQMNAHLNRSRRLWLNASSDWRHLYKHHQQMAAYIEAQDGERAEALMQEHLSLSITDLEVLRAQYSEYFIPASSEVKKKC